MRKSIIIMIVTAIVSQAFTLYPGDLNVEENDQVTAAEISDDLSPAIGDNLLSTGDQDPILSQATESKWLMILESLEGNREIEMEEYNDRKENRRWEDDYDKRTRNRRAASFRGHWAGVETGFNNYNFVSSMDLPDDISYMSLNTSRSNCLNINFSQLSMGFTRHIGLVTGIGLNWNNYRFREMISITVDPSDYITELIPDRPSPLKRSKFSTLYLNVPLLLEIQIPAGYSTNLNLAAGVIGGLKLNAWTKMVFEDEEKFRTNGDFNLNLLRGGATARIGYGNFMLYGTCYLTPWFHNLKGPGGHNLEPFEIGIAFTIND